MSADENVQTSSLAWPWLVTVLLAAIALRLLFFNGTIGSDDVNYFRFARSIWTEHTLGDPSDYRHQGARLALLAIVALPGVISGDIAVAESVNVALSVAIVALVAVFCLRFVGAVGALVAAAFVALDVPSVVHAGILLPEPLLALSMFGSTALLFIAAEGVSPPMKSFAALASGALAAIAYSTKEPGLLLIVPTTAYLVLSRRLGTVARRIGLLACFAVGFVIVGLVDGALLYALTGDPLYKIHGISAHNEEVTNAWTLSEVARSLWLKLYDVSASPIAVAMPLGLGMIGWCAIAYRRSRLMPFALTGAFVLIYLLFGSSSMTRYVGLPFQERYFTPVIAYCAVGLGAAVQWQYEVEAWRRRVIVIVTVILSIQLGASMVLSAERSGRLFFTEGLRNLAIAVSALPDDDEPIYAVRRTLTALDLILDDEHRRRLRPIADASAPGAEPGYYALLLRGEQALWLEPSEEERIRALPLATRARLSNQWAPWPRFAQMQPVRDWAEVRHGRLDEAGTDRAAEPRETNPRAHR